MVRRRLLSLPTGHDRSKTRGAQVGFLMKAYRESFRREGGRRGISQKELLSRMASVVPGYARISSHGTVSRWESGDTAATAERLEVFGEALDLPAEEIQGLILLAGLDPWYQESRTLTCPVCGEDTVTHHTERIQRVTGTEPTVTAATRTRRCVACGHTAESWERWADDHDEVTAKRIEQVLGRIEAATDQIRQALREADTIHRQRQRDGRDRG